MNTADTKDNGEEEGVAVSPEEAAALGVELSDENGDGDENESEDEDKEKKPRKPRAKKSEANGRGEALGAMGGFVTGFNAQLRQSMNAPVPLQPPVQTHVKIDAVREMRLRVKITGDILVVKPVLHEVAQALSIISPDPPKAGGPWTEAEKKARRERIRAEWKAGKDGIFLKTLEQMSMSDGSGYGFNFATIMKAMQTANTIVPKNRIHPLTLNTGLRVIPNDPVNNLIRAVSRHPAVRTNDPFLKMDAVRVGHKPENPRGTPGITIRPCWLDWESVFELEYTANLLDGETVYNLLMWAGRCGICEGRPSQGSGLGWGTFRVEPAEESPAPAKAKK